MVKTTENIYTRNNRIAGFQSYVN
uniref:Uncharacterized protein n=1 Tax=Rhizophora mucronata TaxID=61149 RepID=A0A2P2NX40_RHIMU